MTDPLPWEAPGKPHFGPNDPLPVDPVTDWTLDELDKRRMIADMMALDPQDILGGGVVIVPGTSRATFFASDFSYSSEMVLHLRDDLSIESVTVTA